MNMLTSDDIKIKKHIAIIKNDIHNFTVVNKHESKFHKFVGRIIPNWLKLSTTLFPRVYMSFTKEEIDKYPRAYLRTLQHEWVHLKDAKTFFGILPTKLKWFNAFLFYVLYLCPQLLSVFSLLGFMNPLFFAFVLFALPLPSPIRAISEIRAYRRSRELGADVDGILENFTTSKYYYMWPFKKHVSKLIQRPSPYRLEMDKAWTDSTGEMR